MQDRNSISAYGGAAVIASSGLLLLAVAAVLLLSPGHAPAAAAGAGTIAAQQERQPTTTARPKKQGAKKKQQRKANRKVKRQVKNGHYVGTRGDGLPIDKLVCAKEIRDGPSTYRNWKVKHAKLNKRGFKAIVQAKVKGGRHVFAIARVRKQWKIGIEYFGQATQLGNVTRTNARKECKKL